MQTFSEIGLGAAGTVIWGFVLVAFVAMFALIAERRWSLLWVMQGKDDRFHEWPTRLKALLRDGFAQGRMPRKRYALVGVAHVFIFWGFIVLGAQTTMLAARGFVADFHLPLLDPETFLGKAYLLAKDFFVLAVLVAVVAAALNRLVVKPARLTLSSEALLILGMIGTLMVTDLLIDGATHRLHGVGLAWWSVNGAVVARAMGGLSVEALQGVRGVCWWTHMVTVLAFLNLLPRSKHFHVIASLPNIFFRATDPPGRLARLNFEEEGAESFGRSKVLDFTWKNALDWYTCTECGRCSDNCPATKTTKPLSPKHLTMALRNHLYEHGDDAIAAARGGPPLGEDHPLNAPIVPDVLQLAGSPAVEGPWLPPDIIWACNTCRACEHACPVHIEYVDLIVDLRRYQVMTASEFPKELTGVFKGMENNSNPWGVGYDKREDWAQGLDVPVLKEGEKAPEWLFWVGCAGAFDDRNVKVSQALTKIMKRAGVEFAILGCRECCTGDPARRAGNEYLFDTLAKQNAEVLNGHGVKKVVTACPHCFNTLKNEYRDYGAELDVMHHSQLIARLVKDGRLKPGKTAAPGAGDGDGKRAAPAPAKIAFHDSCYLGRYNDEFDAPRDALRAVPGVTVAEPSLNRADSLCCGAGGARMWMEEPVSQRVNLKRFEDLRATQPDAVGVACPFCMTMMSDAVKHHGLEDKIQVLDVSEVVARSLD
ncbi:MAG TPA: (Fe-S)-binding protein [Myxococcota bacterium]|jgi:Fe-S oxidoreductase|nr:(Fe-S)-binding protein [Myxococcota bacterium]